MIRDLQLTQFYGHFNIASADFVMMMLADAILKMTLKLSQLKIAQLGS